LTLLSSICFCKACVFCCDSLPGGFLQTSKNPSYSESEWENDEDDDDDEEEEKDDVEDNESDWDETDGESAISSIEEADMSSR